MWSESILSSEVHLNHIDWKLPIVTAFSFQIIELSDTFLVSAALEKKVKELYKTVVALEEEKYDWEVKIRKQVSRDSSVWM